MPELDRREPAVYVTIQDVSYVARALEIGRIGYIVTMCDRGPHNRVVRVTSREEFYKLFGKPNYRRTALAHYLADKFLQYSSNLLIVRAMTDDAYLANTRIVKSGKDIPIGATHKYTFSPDKREVIASDLAAYNAIVIGSWIFAKDDNVDTAGHVVSKTNTIQVPLRITLQFPYTGTINTETSAKTCIPYRTVSSSSIKNEDSFIFPETTSGIVYIFYAKGAGTYYNNIRIMGIRNVKLEKMYTNDRGNILYPYLFMDIGVYYLNTNGRYELLEGPWTVSLTQNTAYGSAIRDISSGEVLYISDVINKNSKFVGCKPSKGVNDLVATGSITETIATRRRYLVQECLLANPVGGTKVATMVDFENGTDGTVDSDETRPMYNSSNNLETDRTRLEGCVKLAYNGSLTSTDGSIEQLPECIYPWYQPDYIITGGYPANVQDAGRYLAAFRQDCIHFADTGGFIKSGGIDIDLREGKETGEESVSWNDWTSALFVQYRRISDPFTGELIWMTPVYHAIERHLYCDGAYFIAEPVSGIEKGAITEPIELAYKANHELRGDLGDNELNCVIVEPQGKYIHTQYTTWKRLSVLKRLHVAKFVAYLRKIIPPLLKDILSRRATQYWIGQAQFRVANLLSKFLESSIERYSVLKSFNVAVTFDDVSSELNVIIDITPIRAIERINVFIIVH